MIFRKIDPSHFLQQFIECFWQIDSVGNVKIETQKIIPDGYPETIFHYKDSYEIKIHGDWERQPKMLLGGQLKKHFFLRNTGESGMIGIKWKPAALAHLFDLKMDSLTNDVIELPDAMHFLFSPLMGRNLNLADEHPLELLDDFLSDQLKDDRGFTEKLAHKASTLILNKEGLINIKELTNRLNCSERQLERVFKSAIGLSPKFYSRIIRMGKTFELMKEGNNSWSDLVYESGFYDQPHFIKNFKEFTGEDPSAYGFEERNMANFHLKKS
jgi:AraC-like DNA-binding protein